MSMIQGVHHIALRLTAEQFPVAKKFYSETLELPVMLTWRDGACAMISAGNAILELLTVPEALPENGMFQHVALATDHVDELIEKVRAMGLNVTIEPKDVVLGENPGLHARIAFFEAPTGETIELFCDKGMK